MASGTVHALLGENGAGKSTLMRIAFGLLQPDAGSITLDGILQRFASPAEAIASGIGMVHQHFALVPAMTVAENVALGGSGRYDRVRARDTVTRLSSETGLPIDPDARVEHLSIGEQQRVEILKALSRKAGILILDEPTAVLSPAEAHSLLDWIRSFAQGDRSAILITHKVREAIRIADHVTVLRKGQTVFDRRGNSTTEDELAHAMVDQTPIGDPPAPRVHSGTAGPIVTLRSATVAGGTHGGLAETTLSVMGGQLLGVAGVEGSGYHELLRLLAAKISPSTGERLGPALVGFIPEDRHGEALALELSAVENIALRGVGAKRGLLRWRSLQQRTGDLAKRYDVRGTLGTSPVRQLSGGNQQKLVLARELDDAPMLVVAESPTRGLDIAAAAAVRARLLEARDRGAAVVVYSRDVDELLALADRIVVVHACNVREVPVRMEAVARALVGLPHE